MTKFINMFDPIKPTVTGLLDLALDLIYVLLLFLVIILLVGFIKWLKAKLAVEPDDLRQLIQFVQ